MIDPLLRRLEEVEQQVGTLALEIEDLRRQVVARSPRPQAAQPSAAAVPPPPPRLAPPPPAPKPAAAPRPQPRRKPARPRREIDLADLLGAKALAWAGGLVTLLGVVFFFALAVNRGWIGPVERVALGGLASALLFGGGLFMRARYGQLHSSLAAVGAGIAGAYATLLAAAALYDLVPALAALGLAAGIAAIGTAVSLAWSAQTIAAFGLVGAMLVPLAVVLDGGLSALGTGFVAIVFAAGAAVAIRKGWRELLAASGLASLPQMAVLAVQQGEGAPGWVVALAAAFWALSLAAGVAWQLRSAKRLDGLASSFLVLSGAVATVWAGQLLNGETLGVDRTGGAIFLAFVVYGVLAAAFFRGARTRDLSALLAALGLTVGAIAAAALLAGPSLALVWAAEAVVLAWLAGRVGETRFGIGALAYLGLAAGHVLALDAPPSDLFAETASPADGALVALAVGLAALAAGGFARTWALPGETPSGFLADLFDAFARARSTWVAAALGGGAVLTLFAASLGLLGLHEWLDVPDDFGWGHVSVTGLWAAMGGLALLVGVRRRHQGLEVAGLVWLAATATKLLAFDGDALRDAHAGTSALVLAGFLLVAGFVGDLLQPRGARGPGLLLASAAFAASGLVQVFHGSVQGAAFVVAAGLYAGFAAGVFTQPHRRNLSTTLWGSAAVLGLAGSVQLLSHSELVGVWALAAAVLAWLGDRTRERRLVLAADAFLVLALGLTLVKLAPPTELFLVARGPADGVPALVFVIVALAAVVRYARSRAEGRRDPLDDRIDRGHTLIRPHALWSLGVLALYGGSLFILEVSQWLGGADLTTEFQRGHTAVSAFWGVVGLVLLYLGLTRAWQALRLAGFALLGVSLAKVFLYDLSTLSSVTRALSFLAVGFVLLLAGFFYQRLSASSNRAAL